MQEENLLVCAYVFFLTAQPPAFITMFSVNFMCLRQQLITTFHIMKLGLYARNVPKATESAKHVTTAWGLNCEAVT
jgi:hypothetical protein